MLAKSKLNSIKLLISQALIDSNISLDEFVLINNVLKEFYDIKKKKKIPITNKSLNYYKTMLCYCFKCRINTESKNPKVAESKNGWMILLSKCARESKRNLCLKCI